MTRLTTPIACCLLALFAAPAFAQDAEKEDRRRLAIERIRLGDCVNAVRFGEDGPEVMSLGSHAYLGVELTALTPELRRHFGVPGDAGVMIGRVDDGSPAAAAGLRVGDIVTRFDGEDVTSAGRLGRLVRAREKDDAVTLEYWRDGQAATATATLGERARCGFDVGALIDLENGPLLKLDELPRMLELGALPEIEDLPAFEHVFEFDRQGMDKAMERMREAFESQDWESHLKRLEAIDVDAIEERLRAAMERLRELEDEIESTRERIDDRPQI